MLYQVTITRTTKATNEVTMTETWKGTNIEELLQETRQMLEDRFNGCAIATGAFQYAVVGKTERLDIAITKIPEYSNQANYASKRMITKIDFRLLSKRGWILCQL